MDILELSLYQYLESAREDVLFARSLLTLGKKVL